MAKDSDKRPPVPGAPTGASGSPGRPAGEAAPARPAQPETVPSPGRAPDAPAVQKTEAQRAADRRAEAADESGAVHREGGQNEPTPDGLQDRTSEKPPPPLRPDSTTQQPRPGTGGGLPEQTHPDRPDVHGMATAVDPDETDEEKKVRQTRERSASGNVYRVIGDWTEPHPVGAVLAPEDFPTGTDFARLIRLRVIEPVGDLRPERVKMDRARYEDEIEELQQKLERAEGERDHWRKRAQDLEGQVNRGPGRVNM